MRRSLDRFERFAIDVILERRYGRRAQFLRWVLFGLSVVYRGIVQTRLMLYKMRYKRVHSLGCAVISVGNLTVGGTGKTPVVEMLARELQKRGRRLAILSRGYKRARRSFIVRIRDRVMGKAPTQSSRVVSDGRSLLLDSLVAGDEPFMLANNLRGVPVVVDKDRVKGGIFAVKRFGVDTLILDDGLQYLRLRHAIEIVLIDRQAPFGNEYLLPRGTLREPPENLRRAHYIFITKSRPGENAGLIRLIRRFNRTAPVIECTHRPLILRNIQDGSTQPLTFLQNLRVGAISGIAVPESFENGLRQLGAKLELSLAFSDHYRFRPYEIENFVRRCARREIAAVITTEKDAVRFPRIPHPEVPIYFLRVEIEIFNGHAAWEDLLQQISAPPPYPQ